jgi:hypothetical protein
MTTTVELVSYRLKDNISKEQLAATHNDVNQFLQQQQGFMYRSCSEDDNGLIYDIVYWQNMESAKAAGEAFMNHPAGQSLVVLCDESSLTMNHMELLSEKANFGEKA